MTESRPNIPWSSEAEQSILGGLLLDNAAIDLIPELRAEHFFSAPHRRIFVALVSLLGANKPADVITVFERLQAGGDADETGGMVYLNSLSQSVPSASNIRSYAAIVIERCKARALLAAGSAAMAAARDQETPIAERIEKVSGELMRLLEQDSAREAIPMSELVVAHTQTLEDRAAGKTSAIPLGLADLDEQLGGGVEPGDLVILGARPSMGKTAFALTAAERIAAQMGVAVGFLSQEMTQAQYADRCIALIGRIDMRDLKRPPRNEPAAGAFWKRVLAAADAAADLRVYTDFQGGLTISQVRSKVRAMRRKYGIKVAILDYLQLMCGTNPDTPRAYQLEEITRGLKALAKDLGIAILALAQINRRVDGRADAMPTMSDLKDSGAIEQDADTIVFLHRPIVTQPKLPDEWKFFAQAFVAKQRQGPIGLVNLSYIGHETRFASWSGPAPSGNFSHPPGERKARKFGDDRF